MILFRSIFLEMIGPFFLTLGVTSFTLMMGKIYNLISLMVERHLAFAEGAMMFAFLIPQSVTVMLPIGVLGAVLITVIRQSVDSEVIAMRAAGESLWRYAGPILTFGLVGVGLTAAMTLAIQPAANRLFLDLQIDIIRAHAEDGIVPGELNFDFGDKVIRIGKRMPDKEVRSVFLADRQLKPGSPVVVADRGRIVVDEERGRVVFRLQDGQMYTEGEDPAVFHTATFGTLDYVLELGGPAKLDTREVEARWTYPTRELLAGMEAAAPGSLEWNRLAIEFYTRVTTPWACLAFAAAALPLALVNPRLRRTGGILRAIFLVLAYYVLWIGTRNVVMAGDAHPAMLALPAVLIALFGVFRIWRMNRNAA